MSEAEWRYDLDIPTEIQMTDSLKLSSPHSFDSLTVPVAEKLALVMRSFNLAARRRRERRKVMQLLRLDQNVLADIGIDAHDVENVLHNSRNDDVIDALQRLRQQRSGALICKVGS